MGFNLMLRRATPTGTRTVAVPTATTFQKTVTISIRPHKKGGGTDNILPTASRRFSPETAKKQDILRTFFNSEPQQGHDGSPFKVVDISSDDKDILYARDYKGEYTIVHFYNLKESDEEPENGEEPESDDESESDDEPDSDDEFVDSEWCGRKLSMYVVKPNGWLLEFGAKVFKGACTADDLTLTNTESGDEFVYCVNDLDRELEAAFMKFHRVRDLNKPANVGFDVSSLH